MLGFSESALALRPSRSQTIAAAPMPVIRNKLRLVTVPIGLSYCVNPALVSGAGGFSDPVERRRTRTDAGDLLVPCGKSLSMPTSQGFHKAI